MSGASELWGGQGLPRSRWGLLNNVLGCSVLLLTQYRVLTYCTPTAYCIRYTSNVLYWSTSYIVIQLLESTTSNQSCSNNQTMTRIQKFLWQLSSINKHQRTTFILTRMIIDNHNNDDSLQRMEGDWECESQLGSGGFGIVHVWRNRRWPSSSLSSLSWL